MRTSKIAGFIAIAGVGAFLAGCLNGGTDAVSENGTRIQLQTNLKDVGATREGGLGKASVITLDRLIVTLASVDTVIRDTVLAGTGTFVSDASVDQSYSRAFAITPLRNWTVVAKTLDVNDSVVHYDSVAVPSLFIGETRNVTLELASRFVMYEAKFAVPDSLRSSQSGMSQGLDVRRFVMIVDGDTVADSTATPRFLPTVPGTTPVVHTVRYDYINSGTSPDVLLQFFGRPAGFETDTLLFQHIFVDVDPSNPNPDGVAPEYVGPGANGISGAVAGMVVNIGKVGTVVFETDISGEVF